MISLLCLCKPRHWNSTMVSETRSTLHVTRRPEPNVSDRQTACSAKFPVMQCLRVLSALFVPRRSVCRHMRLAPFRRSSVHYALARTARSIARCALVRSFVLWRHPFPHPCQGPHPLSSGAPPPGYAEVVRLNRWQYVCIPVSWSISRLIAVLRLRASPRVACPSASSWQRGGSSGDDGATNATIASVMLSDSVNLFLHLVLLTLEYTEARVAENATDCSY